MSVPEPETPVSVIDHFTASVEALRATSNFVLTSDSVNTIYGGLNAQDFLFTPNIGYFHVGPIGYAITVDEMRSAVRRVDQEQLSNAVGRFQEHALEHNSSLEVYALREPALSVSVVLPERDLPLELQLYALFSEVVQEDATAQLIIRLPQEIEAEGVNIGERLA